MKILNSLSILLIITGIFNSCNNDIILEDSLDEQLIILQEKVLTKDYDIIDRRIKNVDFFQEVNIIRNSKSDHLAEAFLNKYHIEDDQEIIILSNREKLFYKSFSESLKLSELHFLEVTQLYLNNIDKLHLSLEEKKRATEGFSLFKDLLVFINFEITNEQSLEGVNWSWDCRNRDCWDCCMYYKALELSEQNWIEKAWFIMSAPQSTAVWTVSCGWDCITGNYE